MTSDALPTTAAAAPRLPRPVAGALLSNAVFGGITAVGVPVALDAAGLAKVQIAVFFVVNAAIAIAYNTLLVPRIRRAGYPRAALLATSSRSRWASCSCAPAAATSSCSTWAAR